jgi:hypothetical protein
MSEWSRLVSSSGAFAANAALVFAFEARDPPLYWPTIEDPPAVAVPNTPWRPFIDNPKDDRVGNGRRLRCPPPAGVDGGVRLAEAPLPPSYDPDSYPNRAIFACVRVDAQGRITSAWLIGGVGRKMEARLVRTIRREWRFDIESFGPSEPTWQRVRLNWGPVDEAVWDPPMMLM